MEQKQLAEKFKAKKKINQAFNTLPNKDDCIVVFFIT